MPHRISVHHVLIIEGRWDLKSGDWHNDTVYRCSSDCLHDFIHRPLTFHSPILRVLFVPNYQFVEASFFTMVNWILGEKFYERYPHLSGIKALWESKWKLMATLSAYPFHDGKLEDFAPIFEKLIQDNVNDAYSDTYTEYFLPTAERLTDAALSAQASDHSKAIDLFKRAACVYRISRFPSLDAGPGLKRKAFEMQKQVYLRGASLWPAPMKEVKIPHTAAEGDDGHEIPLFVRLPPGASRENKCPVVLLVTGLDGHRPDNTEVSKTR